MLYDAEFLRKLDEYKTKTTYARIIALTQDEDPVETIEGRVTEGSVNVDGDSSVRRTCSLTIIAQDFNYNNYLWGLNTKFKLEIGVENVINDNYPSIIWFKQGTYFISSFSTSRSTNNFSISIQGKDKMCALNGEIGGMLTSSVDFGVIDEIDNTGKKQTIKLPIKDIIRNVVHLYGGEPAHNIIINDLDIYGLELLEYRYDTPMYLYRDTTETVFNNITLDGEKRCKVGVINTTTGNTDWYAYKDDSGNRYITAPTDVDFPVHMLTLKDLTVADLEMLVNPMTGSSAPKKIQIDDKEWYVAKISYGETAGYRFTDLTYAGDLIGNVGESLTSILDKIKGMLGDFEYFYDLDGNFIFQKKETYLSTNWTPLSGNNDGGVYITDESAIRYVFNNGILVTAFNSNPDMSNVKNDYSVWGERQSISGTPLPVHMRYAIDHKPTIYKSINVDYGTTVVDPDTGNMTFTPGADYDILDDYNYKYSASIRGQSSVEYKASEVDWRELIYQMAADYYKYAHILDDFELRVIQCNPEFYTGKTGYENYYTDIAAFWRDLYDPTLQVLKEAHDAAMIPFTTNVSLLNSIETTLVSLNESIENTQSALAEAETEAEKKTLQSTLEALNKSKEEQVEQKDAINKEQATYIPIIQSFEAVKEKYDNYYHSDAPAYANWAKAVYETPETLNFWFDFLDTNGELSQYSVKNIGCRPKAVNDQNVKAIYFRETPNIIFSTNIEKDAAESSAYTYINAQNARSDIMFTISAQGKSAKNMVDELMYMHGYCMESATITTVPIYYLQPNERIRILDEETNLNGYYVINKLSIPLTYSGTMSITATKAVENI